MWLSIGPLGTNFSEILIKKTKVFIHENASENIVCETAAILSRGRWVNASKFEHATFVRDIINIVMRTKPHQETRNQFGCYWPRLDKTLYNISQTYTHLEQTKNITIIRVIYVHCNKAIQWPMLHSVFSDILCAVRQYLPLFSIILYYITVPGAWSLRHSRTSVMRQVFSKWIAMQGRELHSRLHYS